MKNSDIILFNNAATKANGSNPKMPDISGSILAPRDIRKGEEVHLEVWRAKDDDGKIRRTSKGNDYLVGKVT